MKICHFSASRGLGRGEIYVDLANEMSRVAEVSLLVPKGAKYLKRVDPKVSVIEYTSRNTRNNPFLLLEIYNIIQSVNPDIVHTHFAKATGIFNLVNLFAHHTHVATKHNSRKGAVFNRIKHVTAVSKEVRRTIDNSDVRIIYNGIIPAAVEHTPVADTPFSILAVGRLDRIKGFDQLIKQASIFTPDFQLRIIGEGSEREALEKLIQENELASRVSLPGYREDIPELMQQAHLVVISSRSEGFSLTMIESLFYANLLISTRVSGATEILPDKLLIDDFNIADKLEDIYKNYSEYTSVFSELKKELQQKFTMGKITQDYLAYYEEISGLTRQD